MRLSIFAYHVGMIMTDEGEFGLHPCEGVNVQVKIVHHTPTEGGLPWDEVFLNGRICGNRWGGMQEFTKLVNEAKPVIEYT